MPRKKLVAYAFTFLAALGLCMYLVLPAESELRLLGLIVLMLWLPMALRYVSRLAKERATALLMPKTSPSAYHAREVNATLEVTFSVTVGTDLMRFEADSGILDLRCLLALGTDGFSARLWRADKITGPWPNDETLILNADFYRHRQGVECEWAGECGVNFCGRMSLLYQLHDGLALTRDTGFVLSRLIGTWGKRGEMEGWAKRSVPTSRCPRGHKERAHPTPAKRVPLFARLLKFGAH